jgi:N6-adenosine-specific RNA methylase IME4
MLKNFPEKKYNTIVLDPPWNISSKGKDKDRPNRKRKLDYITMSIDEIKSIPLDQVANIGCHVYCWTTNKFLKEAFDVFESWNVNYHLTLVWTKPNGIMPCYGYKFATEFCLFGFYGKPMQKFQSMAKLNWFENPSIKPHSTKPQKFFSLVDEMSPSPKVELFARQKRQGWSSWGNEIYDPG